MQVLPIVQVEPLMVTVVAPVLVIVLPLEDVVMLIPVPAVRLPQTASVPVAYRTWPRVPIARRFHAGVTPVGEAVV